MYLRVLTDRHALDLIGWKHAFEPYSTRKRAQVLYSDLNLSVDILYTECSIHSFVNFTIKQPFLVSNQAF